MLAFEEGTVQIGIDVLRGLGGGVDKEVPAFGSGDFRN